MLIAGSVFLAWIIGIRLDETYLFEILIVDLILFFTIMGFKKYEVKEIVQCRETAKYEFMYRYIKFFAVIGILANVILISSSFKRYMSLAVSISVFKNQGLAIDFISNSPFYFLTTVSLICSPFSYMALGYHFYFLCKGNKKSAIKSLILSFGIFLPNLVYLSRAGAVTYILMYLAYWYYIKNVFSKKIRKKVSKIVTRTMGVIMFILILISQNRFSSYAINQEPSLIKNPVIYSMTWYFAQWFRNGLVLINRYNPSLNLRGSSFAYIINKFRAIGGVEMVDIKILRETAFGNLATHFNGLPAVLIYDLGYLGAILFSIIFFFVVKRFSPKHGKISLDNFLVFSVLIPMPLMFFQGNYFTIATFNLAIVYLLFIRFVAKYFVRVKKKV